jgi:hypothetical protein
MDNVRLACLLALSASASACAAEPERTDDGLPPAAARALKLAPGADYVATLVPGQLRRHPDTVPDAAESIAGLAWRGFAWVLDLDPVDDAATVAVAGYVGPCGMNEVVAVVGPSTDADLFAARVDAAIEASRREHPMPPGEEAGDPPDPALSRWVAVPDGACTILQRNDFEAVGVTITHAGLLELRSTFSGHACSAGTDVGAESGIDLAPEALEATRLAGRALAKSVRQLGSERPTMIEAMPGGRW